MTDKIALESLASDLKRISLGLQRNSQSMVKVFKSEALKRQHEINPNNIDPYIVRLLNKMEQTLKEDDPKKLAEDTLMYSTLFQNYAQKKLVF